MNEKISARERFLTAYFTCVVKTPVRTLLFCLVVFLVTIAQLRSISLDTSTEGYLHEQDPALMAYNDFRRQFGRDEIIVVAINPPDIFNLDFLTRLKQLHRAIETQLPYLDEVTSLINARHTYGDKDTLIVEDLLQDWPQNSDDLRALRDKVDSNPLYKNLLISESDLFTTLLIKTDPSLDRQKVQQDPLAGFDDGLSLTETDTSPSPQKTFTSSKDSEIISTLNQILDHYRARDFPIYVAGTPVMAETLKSFMRQDMRKFTAAAILLIIISLFALFRRISGVVLPLIVIVASTLSTLGIMAWFNVAIKLPTQILPSFLLAIGVAATIHLLSIFFQAFDKNQDKPQAIMHALRHTGVPIIMTSITTAVGLLSFSTAQVAPIADLGVFAGLGVLISLMYTLVMLPSLLALAAIRNRHRSTHNKRHLLMDKLLLNMSGFALNNARCIVIAAGMIFLAAALCLPRLYFYHNPLHWLPADSDIRVATDVIDQAMGGSNTLEVIIDTHQTNGLYNPNIIGNIDALQKDLEKNGLDDRPVGKTVAISNILKETHRALHGNDKKYYQVPDNRELIAQELLLFENSGSNDLEEMADSQLSTARLSVKIPWADARSNADATSMLTRKLHNLFADDTGITVTGMVALMGRTMYAAINSTKNSYFIAFGIITLLMLILLRSPRLGLLSMVPNLLPIVTVLGFMAYRDIPLDMFTMLIGSIAIGIVVDDTIHFLHVFKRHFDHHHDVRLAVQETLLSSGRAILITSIVLACGFFVYAASTLHNLQAFGLLTGITIIVALLADLFLLPAILLMLYRNRQFPQAQVETTESNPS